MNERSAEEGASAERPTVLVVDDTPDNLSLMSGLLKDRPRGPWTELAAEDRGTGR